MCKSVTEQRLAYSVAELAQLLGVSKGFLRLEIKRGRLSARHLGHRVVIPTAEALRYLQGGDKESHQGVDIEQSITNGNCPPIVETVSALRASGSVQKGARKS